MTTDKPFNLIFKLAYYPSSHLRNRTQFVTDFTDIPEIAEAMFETMLINGGIGLSANQCKLSHRMFVMRTENLRKVFVNPTFGAAEGSKLIEEDERCLSFPGIVVKMPRYHNIMVVAQDVAGNRIYQHMTGLEAICAQHEIDHLDGKTFIDDRSGMKRKIVERTVKKALKDEACRISPKRI